MKLFSRKPLRILGVPVGTGSRDERLRAFEPENPRLFVPRSFGIGWDLNAGAVAVKLGLIRPDDSLPDLAAHIPPRTVQALKVAPIIGAAAVAATAYAVGRSHETLPGGWTATFRPKAAKPARDALLPHVVGSTAVAGWTAWEHSRDEGVDVVGVALALAVQSAALLDAVAATHATKRPGRPSLLAGLAAASVPTVMTGVVVATIKSALNHLDHELKTGTDGRTPSERH